MQKQTQQSCFREMKNHLADAGIDSPELDAKLILRFVLGASEADLICNGAHLVSLQEAKRMELLLKRRIGGEPISRIFGVREFWGLDFKVTPDVLDPRADTETLIEAALSIFGDTPPESVLDLGTGSGCILISLLSEWKETRGVAVDISSAALNVAKSNAVDIGVFDRIRFIQGDWNENLDESFDLVVSNPPYIPNPDIESLAVEVKNHDPILALDGGIDGMEAYEKIIFQLNSLLNTNGTCLLEIGKGQEKDISRLVENAGANLSRTYTDLSGVLRVVEISSGDK